MVQVLPQLSGCPHFSEPQEKGEDKGVLDHRNVKVKPQAQPRGKSGRCKKQLLELASLLCRRRGAELDGQGKAKGKGEVAEGDRAGRAPSKKQAAP